MDKEKEFMDNLKAQVAGTIDEKLVDVASKEQLDALKASLEDSASKESLEALKEIVEKIGLDVDAAKERVSGEPTPSKLKSAITDNWEKLELPKLKASKGHMFQFKAFDTNTIGGVGNWDNFLEPQYIDGIARTPNNKERFNILNYVTVGQAFSEIVKWIEEDVETGAALFIDECVQKPEAMKAWKRGEAKIRKIAVYARVCDEVFHYLDWAEQEIRAFLRKLVYEGLQKAIMNGDGTGEKLLGITAQASAFVAGDFAASVPMANEADAIAAALAQVNCMGCQGDYVMLNCVDIFKLNQALKTADGQYLAMRIGVPVIENPYIAPGSFLVGDFSKSNVRFFRQIEVEAGLNGEDFRENAISLRGEAYLTHYIAAEHQNCFVYDTFANVISLIDKP